MVGTRLRRHRRASGFTLLETSVTLGVSGMALALAMSAYVFVIRGPMLASESMAKRQDALNVMHRVKRIVCHASSMTEGTYNEQPAILVWQDLQTPRTPLLVSDDTQGAIWFDAELGEVHYQADLAAGTPQVLGRGIDAFLFTRTGNLLNVQCQYRYEDADYPHALQTSFALRNDPPTGE